MKYRITLVQAPVSVTPHIFNAAVVNMSSMIGGMEH